MPFLGPLFPQHCLYFFPLPHGHGEFLAIFFSTTFFDSSLFINLFSFFQQCALRAIATQAQFSAHQVLELHRRHNGIAIAYTHAIIYPPQAETLGAKSFKTP